MAGEKLATTEARIGALALLKKQRSHVLFIFSNSTAGRESDFLKWYQGTYREQVAENGRVLRARYYEQHEIDITRGRYPRIAFHYLTICELSLDGAEEAAGLIEHLTLLHREQPAAEPPATWLYYPANEKVGRSPVVDPAMLVLAFANGVAGHEGEFREWYSTRHLRHALAIPALVSGQCYERTGFQHPGAMHAGFSTIAVYEQEDGPQSILDSFDSLPEGALQFPTLDKTRFAECAYKPV